MVAAAWKLAWLLLLDWIEMQRKTLDQSIRHSPSCRVTIAASVGATCRRTRGYLFGVYHVIFIATHPLICTAEASHDCGRRRLKV